jgi:retinol dehydrogenase 12
MTTWNIAEKHVLISGATSGIGLATALELAARGAHLTLIGRDRSRGSTAVGVIKQKSNNPRVEFLQADFASLDSVRALCDAYLAGGKPLDVLINNAGIFNARRRISEESIEEMFAVNYLAHYLLTRALLARMQQSAAARIVHVSSGAHRKCERINFTDINHARKYAAYRVYGHSKLANILFSNELARRLEGTAVMSNAMHPGVVATGFGRNNGWIGRAAMRVATPFLRTPQQGAATAVYLSCAPELDSVSGKYFVDEAPREPTPIATDIYEARRLWEFSERLLDGYL